jgi:hypothetical protein
MAKTDSELHQEYTRRFIDLANAIKDEGIGTNVVSASLMTASAVYATFVVGGNTGGLTESGVEKVTAAYKQQLEQVQRMKKEESDRLQAEAEAE